MTAKEALLHYVEHLDEDAASEAWDLLRNSELFEREPLTPAQIASVRRGLAQLNAGLSYTTEEVLSDYRVTS